jgi:hypothetical protein
VNPDIFLSSVAELLAHQSPLLLVAGGGLAFVGYHYQRAPRAARIALLGLALMFAAGVVHSLLVGVMMAQSESGTIDVETVTLIGWVTVLVRGIGLALVVQAVIIDRPIPV